MIRKIFLLSLLSLSALLLLASSCKPTCATEALVAPELVDPPNWGYASSTLPSLQWTYPDTSCNPEGFRIDLYGGPNYSTDLSGGTGTGNATSWSPGTSLEPASQYKWRVTAINGTTLGPPSNWRRFMTPPACSLTDDLVPPAIIYPEDGATVTTTPVMISMAAATGCLPEGIGMQVSQDPTFSDQITFFMDFPPLNWLSPDLEDCSIYYVRSYADRGDTEIAYSEPNMFFTDFTGTCPAPETNSAIGGVVWSDLCSVAMGTVPSTIPSNCVLDHTGTIVYADGIRQPGEHGIADVTVNLGEGYCPSTGLATAVTDSNGYYEFSNLSAGRYCISIDAESNDALIKQGMWTKYLSGHEGWTFHMELLLPGVESLDNDFGWYHYIEASELKSQCPPGQTWNALSGGCQGQCSGDQTWNFKTGQCESGHPLDCSVFDYKECMAHIDSCSPIYDGQGVFHCVNH
jgi:hypothetical protein